MKLSVVLDQEFVVPYCVVPGDICSSSIVLLALSVMEMRLVRNLGAWFLLQLPAAVGVK